MADQGVLLLNTVLTVRAHQANSHQGHGWEKFTDAIIEAVNEQDRPIVYMLWGASGAVEDSYAYKSKASDIDSTASKPAVGLQRLFLVASILVKPMSFLRSMEWSLLTGR